MKKWRVLVRDDKSAINVHQVEETVEFDGTRAELLSHAHILEILDEVEDVQSRPVFKEPVKEDKEESKTVAKSIKK